MQNLVEKWLQENTFVCPLGRVSLKQCKANRARPSLGTYVNNPLAVYKPAPCENCNWEKYAFPKKAQKICSVEGCEKPAKVKGRCEKHYASYYYNEKKRIGRQIMEDKKIEEKVTCEDCGREFQPYQRGRQTIRRVCPECMNLRVKKGQIEHTEKPQKRALLLDLSFYPDLAERLREAAIMHIRTLEHQALAYIVEGLERDGIGKGEK